MFTQIRTVKLALRAQTDYCPIQSSLHIFLTHFFLKRILKKNLSPYFFELTLCEDLSTEIMLKCIIESLIAKVLKNIVS